MVSLVKVVDWDLVVKSTALAVPCIATYIGYRFGLKSKKTEILIQQKVAAFQQINEGLTDFKRYLMAVIAENSGNEFAPHPEEGEGALTHREKLHRLYEKHSIFLSSKSRKEFEDLIGEMSLLNNAELNIAADKNTDINWMSGYPIFVDKVDRVIAALYKDLNL
ncbi:hypothetical protein OGH69_08940 [Flavobacterium sp. MFBS3-15]|uniref:hypothetical protein n=1 Tax=Flavobacterium sp. MFBS3-15 TaxID=2989816 RepID=UPI0022368832|nr:hypothetical protein [Flavobacterium sp. MFBS3-15]MCW4469087.1 hypothetical protein [Flavobacterium sp. MFBS3-15]